MIAVIQLLFGGRGRSEMRAPTSSEMALSPRSDLTDDGTHHASCGEQPILRLHYRVVALPVFAWLALALAPSTMSADDPNPDDVAELIAHLKDPDETVRLKAAKELGKLKAKAKPALETLGKVAESDPDEDVRSVAKMSRAAIRDASETDPVAQKLAAAKDDYKAAAEKARAGLLADLKRKADAAQKAGDLKMLVKVQAEAKAFEDGGGLPKSVPVKTYEGQLGMALARLEEGYAAAVKQYTRDGKIALAKAVQAEWDEFKKGGSELAGKAAWAKMVGAYTSTHAKDRRDLELGVGQDGEPRFRRGGGKWGNVTYSKGKWLFSDGKVDSFSIESAGPGKVKWCCYWKAVEKGFSKTLPPDPPDEVLIFVKR